MSWSRIWAMVLRHTFLLRRSVPRIVEMLFWPVMDLLVWGFVTRYLESNAVRVPGAVTFLLGSVIFWDILFRAQMAVAVGFLEDQWSRNLLNLFSTPLTPAELATSSFIVGSMRIAFTLVVLILLALFAYDFNLFKLGLSLAPLIVNLLLTGWALGLISTALILRWGQAVEALAWAVPFVIQPISAVFYPVHSLPAWLQPICLALPTTHVFEGMRQVLAGGGFPTGHLLWAFALNGLLIAISFGFFHWMFRVARVKGLLVKLGTQ
jgi:ABC-2 type transport system permease protein